MLIESVLQDRPVPPSLWNYLVPATAVIAWGTCAIAAITYGSYSQHNYTYPENPINPHLVSMALKTVEVTAIFGACTIPTAAAWTVGRMFTQFGDIEKMREIFKKSIKGPLGAPDAIILNTLAAPFAGPMLVCAFLAQVR